MEKFIAHELQEWVKTFPDEFYEEIYRLHEWGSPWARRNHPQVVAHFTDDIVYSRLAPSVLNELRRLNPILPEGYRQDKHHQWLTPDVGHPKLKEHLSAVTALMRISNNWDHFQRNLSRAYPKLNSQMVMGLDEDI